MWSCFQPKSSQEEQKGHLPFGTHRAHPGARVSGISSGFKGPVASSGPLTKVLCAPCVWPQYQPRCGPAFLGSWFQGQGAGWGRGVTASSVQLGPLVAEMFAPLLQRRPCAARRKGLVCAALAHLFLPLFQIQPGRRPEVRGHRKRNGDPLTRATSSPLLSEQRP